MRNPGLKPYQLTSPKQCEHEPGELARRRLGVLQLETKISLCFMYSRSRFKKHKYQYFPQKHMRKTTDRFDGPKFCPQKTLPLACGPN